MKHPVLAYTNELVHHLTRKERKALRREARTSKSKQNHSLELRRVEPKTRNQSRIWNEYARGQNILAHGVAGTGKTFISVYLAIKDILQQKYHDLTIVRSVVPTRDMGFLPGSAAKKSEIYEGPYKGICSDIFQRGDAYDILKGKGMVNFTSTSFIRGITIEDSVVLVDECQNMTFHELDTIITRLGRNCKVLFCGDFRQSDLKFDDEKNGLKSFMSIIKRMKQFTGVEFDEEDIVRSGLVKDYIISKLNYGII